MIALRIMNIPHCLEPGSMAVHRAKTTYSWYGDFDGGVCHEHESILQCANNLEYTVNNAYNPHQTLYLPAAWEGWCLQQGCCGDVLFGAQMDKLHCGYTVKNLYTYRRKTCIRPVRTLGNGLP